MSSGLNGDVPSMSLAGMGASNSAQIGTVTAGETARIPVREGAQYGEGVARGGLLENPCEVPKSSRRPRHDDSQRDGFKLEEGSAHVPDVEHGPNGEVRGASRLAGEASSREAATSTVVLGHKETNDGN